MAGERDFRSVGEFPVLVVDGRNVLLTCVHRGLAQVIGHGTDASTLPPGAEVPLALTALMNVVMCVSSVAEECGAARIVIVDDTGHAPWRKRIFPEYKAARKEKPDASGRAQLAGVIANGISRKESWPTLWGLLGVEVVRAVLHEPMEADDIIARIVQDAPGDGYTGAVILSSDGDLFQLIGPTVVQVSPRASRVGPGIKAHEAEQGDVITPDIMRRCFSCGPEDWVFRRAVLGDHSDGIPGVPGVGEKTMEQLFQMYPGGADEILTAATQGLIPGKRAGKLNMGGALGEDQRALVARNMALIGLQPPPLDELVFSSPRVYPEGLEGDSDFETTVRGVMLRLMKSTDQSWATDHAARKVATSLRRVQNSASRFHLRQGKAKGA